MLSYIVVMLGGALGTGARFWASGLLAERAGEFFPLGTLIVNITGSFAIGFLAAFADPEGRFLLSPPFSRILFGRCLRRLHDLFIFQFTNARPHTGWRLVQGLPEYAAVIRLLPRSGMVGTHPCSDNLTKINTSHAHSPRRRPSPNFHWRKRPLRASAFIRSDCVESA